MRSRAWWRGTLAAAAPSTARWRRALGMLCALALCAGAGSLPAQTGVRKISGEVVALDGQKLEVKPAQGAVLTLKLADNVRLTARSAADPARLTAGAFIGTTAVAQPDGTLRAREVHVFAEAMRGTGEGHRPMATEPGSTMTNATIASVGGHDRPASNTMTNATVADISAGAHSRRLTLTYKGGEKVVIVPEGVPIVMVEPGDRSLLTPGAHVVVFAAPQPDGALLAERVTVGKNGFVPPS